MLLISSFCAHCLNESPFFYQQWRTSSRNNQGSSWRNLITAWRSLWMRTALHFAPTNERTQFYLHTECRSRSAEIKIVISGSLRDQYSQRQFLPNKGNRVDLVVRILPQQPRWDKSSNKSNRTFNEKIKTAMMNWLELIVNYKTCFSGSETAHAQRDKKLSPGWLFRPLYLISSLAKGKATTEASFSVSESKRGWKIVA